jgi:type III secretory pathway component EscT
MAGLLQELVTTVERGGMDLRGLGLAWARVTPSVALIPAFGLRALPAPARAVLAVALALSVAPALSAVPDSGLPWPVALAAEMAKGVPIDLVASISMWVAGMAGGVVDDLRGARARVELPHVAVGTTPMGALLALLTALAFLESGGPGRVAALLARPDLGFAGPLGRAAENLAGGVQLAVAVAMPVLVASVVIEVASALVARAASPAFIQPLLAPLRSLLLLGIAALVLERMLELLTLLAARPTGL